MEDRRGELVGNRRGSAESDLLGDETRVMGSTNDTVVRRKSCDVVKKRFVSKQNESF